MQNLLKKNLKIVVLVFYTVIIGCNNNTVIKPKGYFKIDFPKHQYQVFNQAGYPYSFEYPTYATITKDTSFFGEATENPWWINIEFPSLNGKVYISYKQIGKYKLDSLLKHSFKLADAHKSKAYSNEDSLIQTPNNIHGLMFNVGGNVATNNQFFLTDSTTHFLRGAIYFEATPNEDSIMPVNKFVMQDVEHLINTFKWKKN
jgi:gliding motility-associated lipoprotein GldD